jgi:hypothetical protein
MGLIVEQVGSRLPTVGGYCKPTYTLDLDIP